MLACLTEKKIIHNLLVSFVEGKEKFVTWHLQANFIRKHPRELAKSP